jgi:hypothetical protein
MQTTPKSWDLRQDPFGPIDDLVALWGDVVVPIFVENPKSELAMDGLGSAFLLMDGDDLYLVTALHVVQDTNCFGHQVGNFAGKAAHLGGLKFRTSPDHDVAVAHLSKVWLQCAGLERLKALPATKRDDWQGTEVHLFWGYPGTKNRLDQRYGQVNRQMLSISTGRSFTSSVKTPIVDALHISYDHKNVINSALEKLGTQPALQGMSGGPLIHVLKRRLSPQEEQFSVRCEGVLCEWYKGQRIVVASPISVVKELIRDHEI